MHHRERCRIIDRRANPARRGRQRGWNRHVPWTLSFPPESSGPPTLGSSDILTAHNGLIA
jgi:hypothetical protein